MTHSVTKQLSRDTYTTTITSLNSDGRGVAWINGKTIFLPFTLPGERVRFCCTRHSRRHDEGQVEVIEKPAAKRVAPRCEHFGVCGGCSLQHLAPLGQLHHKQQVLTDNLRSIAGINIDHMSSPLAMASSWGYRDKARLGVKYVAKKGRVLVGFRERQSSFITDVHHCPVLHPLVGEYIDELAGLIDALTIKDKIPQVEIAADKQHCVLVFRLLAPLMQHDREKLLQGCVAHNWIPYVQEGGLETVRPLGKPVDLAYSIEADGLQVRFQPTDFIQVNQEVNQLMLAQAMDWLAPAANEHLLDLFCGLGNFTLPLAKRAQFVQGVEGSAPLIARARTNAVVNGCHNTNFAVADLFQEVRGLHWARQQYDAAVLDPPRNGAREILSLLPIIGVRRVLYVSCCPATLARDVGELVQRFGYRIAKAGVIDMFPHTTHVESMFLLIR